MIYEYECPDCNHNFDVIKHHSQYNSPENCIKCGALARKIINTAPMTAKVEKHEYNPGLGCVTKGKKHREEICKQRGLVEVGTENISKIHKTSKKTLEDKLESRYKDI